MDAAMAAIDSVTLLSGLAGFVAGYAVRAYVSIRRRRRFAVEYGLNPPRR